ncbi:hypothetical protein VIGAN_02289000, partial [Vigna angularis var. angularis]
VILLFERGVSLLERVTSSKVKDAGTTRCTREGGGASLQLLLNFKKQWQDFSRLKQQQVEGPFNFIWFTKLEDGVSAWSWCVEAAIKRGRLLVLWSWNGQQRGIISEWKEASSSWSSLAADAHNTSTLHDLVPARSEEPWLPHK